MDKNRYVLLYGYLLARIYFGFYPKGTALPSIYRLSEMFGVSTITSREAIRLLKEKGFVSGSQGKRTSVIFDRTHSVKPPENIFAEKKPFRIFFKAFICWFRLFFTRVIFFAIRRSWINSVSFSIVLTTYWANRHFIICFIWSAD